MTSQPSGPGDVFVPHAFAEHLVDLGEVQMNYSVAGEADLPALVLIPGQTESWWGYEDAMRLLAEEFRVYAVDLRGQGRSTWTPGRYTLDNLGNDLVRFIDLVVQRPVIVSGNSSGGVLAAWLAAYAKPGQLRGVVCEDPPLFASELSPACGHSIRQAIGPFFAVVHKWLGDQWTIGDFAGMQAAVPRELPRYVLIALTRMGILDRPGPGAPDGPPQNLREYDPEWARSFWSGLATSGCDHSRMLSSITVPLLLTHHYREIDPATGGLMGAISDEQVARAQALVSGAGQPVEIVDLPDMVHAMHRREPALFARTIAQWATRLEA
jgi:pimeloyl-ACP methyl ester carboxylesterase